MRHRVSHLCVAAFQMGYNRSGAALASILIGGRAHLSSGYATTRTVGPRRLPDGRTTRNFRAARLATIAEVAREHPAGQPCWVFLFVLYCRRGKERKRSEPLARYDAACPVSGIYVPVAMRTAEPEA